MGNEDKHIQESKSGFVNAIVDAFDRFVQTFKKHGMVAVTFILVLFLCFYSFILHPLNVNEIVMKALQKNEQMISEQKEKSYEQRLAADNLLQYIMENIVERDSVSRVMLFELHNSTQNISGVDFLYMSCTYELLTPEDGEIEYINDSFQRQYLSNFMGHSVMSQLRHRDYISYDNLDNYHRNNYRFIAKLKQYGAKSAMIIPFCIEHGQPLLLLVVVNNNTGKIDAQSIYDYVRQYRKAIETALMKV